MKSYLKTGEVVVEALGGEKLAIRELSARAQVALLELQRDGMANKTAPTVAKYGVIDWEQEAVDDIEVNLPAKALSEIAIAIYRLSGIDIPDIDEEFVKKNLSGQDQNAGSSSDSQPT